MSSSSFRKLYEIGKKINWFPGHMIKSLKLMKEKLKLCSIIIEVRDSRVPVSTTNNLLDNLMDKQKIILLLNKQDLAEKNVTDKFINYYIEQGYCCLAQTTSTNKKSIKSAVSSNQNLINTLKKMCLDINSKAKFKSLPIVVGIVGMPNVGKSSLLNSLRRMSQIAGGGSAKVGATPGLTRHISSFPLIKDGKGPTILLMDTPGILVPAHQLDPETGLKLALAGCIKDGVAGEEVIADYLLFLLNKRGSKYHQKLEMKEPTDDIDELLKHIALKNGMLLPNMQIQRLQAARYFIKLFRDGKFGNITLDNFNDLLNSNNTLEG